VAAGLPADFPPLKAPDSGAHNLSARLTPFIGRQREVRVLGQRPREPATRLLTLTGPGGTGKTRLALQAAAEASEASEAFPDAVFFVPLAPRTDPSLALPTVAAAWERRLSPRCQSANFVGARKSWGRGALAALLARPRVGPGTGEQPAPPDDPRPSAR